MQSQLTRESRNEKGLLMRGAGMEELTCFLFVDSSVKAEERTIATAGFNKCTVVSDGGK